MTVLEASAVALVPSTMAAPLDVTAVGEPGIAWQTVAPGIQLLPGGGYRVRVSAGQGKRPTVGTFGTLEEAIAMREAAREAIKKKRESGNDRITFGDWATKWLHERERSGDVRGIAVERNRANKHVLGTRMARLPIDTVVAQDIREWLAELRQKRVDLEGQRVGRGHRGAVTKPNRRTRSQQTKRLSRQTVRHALKIVRGALASAVESGLIGQNVALGIAVPRSPRVRDDFNVLKPTELDQLIATVPAPVCWIVKFAAWTGLRQGELWALELVDVHTDDETPFVDVRYGAKAHAPTKAGRPRIVPLVAPALEALNAWLAALPAYAPHNPRGLVFPSERGHHRGKKPPRGWHAHTVVENGRPTRVAGWLEQAGIGRRIRWHDLRHTCASTLLSVGVNGRRWTLEEIQALLGHSSITTTEIYAKFARDALMQAARESNGTASGRT